MRLHTCRISLFIALCFGPLLFAQPVRTSEGYDLFQTDETGTDLLGIPFVGDANAIPTFLFTAPPVSANARRAISVTDTIVHRLEQASVPSIPGTADPIMIELVMLRLVSAQPFQIEDRDPALLYVTLAKDRDPTGEIRLNFDESPPDPTPEDPDDPLPTGPLEEVVMPGLRSFGEMTITFENEDGGVFDSEWTIYADLRLGGPDGPIVCGENAGLPPCADFDAGLELTSVDAPWRRLPPPNSIQIRGVNYSMAAPNRNQTVDTSLDFWPGAAPEIGPPICVDHNGHPSPGGAPTRHKTCWCWCSPESITPFSCNDGQDNDCNGTIDDCDEDQFGPEVTPPPDLIGSTALECPRTEAEVHPDITGWATASDYCSPAIVPRTKIYHEDFITELCGDSYMIERIWTAEDDCGRIGAPELQIILVQDTTPPELTVPDDATVLWTAPRDISVFLPLTDASDTCGDVPPPPWNQVPVLGVCDSQEITRTWTATDECGNQTVESQVISVRGSRDAVLDLSARVQAMSLPPDCESDLTNILAQAVESACRGNANAASGQLNAFVNKVGEVDCASIDAADATELVSTAMAIIGAVTTSGVCGDGCGGPPVPPSCPESQIDALWRSIFNMNLTSSACEDALATQVENAWGSLCSGDTANSVVQLNQFISLTQSPVCSELSATDLSSLIAGAAEVTAIIDAGGNCPGGCAGPPARPCPPSCPPCEIDALIQRVEGLGLSSGQARRLLAALNAAITDVCGSDATADEHLEDFVRDINRPPLKNKISAAERQILTDAAEAIIDDIRNGFFCLEACP
jgi:hypothetical protein